ASTSGREIQDDSIDPWVIAGAIFWPGLPSVFSGEKGPTFKMTATQISIAPSVASRLPSSGRRTEIDCFVLPPECILCSPRRQEHHRSFIPLSTETDALSCSARYHSTPRLSSAEKLHRSRGTSLATRAPVVRKLRYIFFENSLFSIT